jgi:hypothetical protein
MHLYTDGSKINGGTEAGVYSHGIKQKFSFSLRQYTTAFQVIKACAVDNIETGYLKSNIYIVSDSQAAIKALDSHEVWVCHQSLMILAERNNV